MFLNEVIGVQYNAVSCKLFSRAYIKGNTYHSLLYKRATKQNSYTIKYLSDSDMKYGQIKYFISVSAPHIPNEQPITICVVETFDNGEISYLETSLPSSSTVLNTYLQGFFVTTTDRKEVQFVKAENIVSPCIRFNVAHNVFLMANFPNRLDFLNLIQYFILVYQYSLAHVFECNISRIGMKLILI